MSELSELINKAREEIAMQDRYWYSWTLETIDFWSTTIYAL